MIRDRLVIGLLDKSVCEQIQLKDDLTLEKAKEMALHHELVKKQNDSTKQVDAVKFKKGKGIPTTIRKERSKSLRPKEK